MSVITNYIHAHFLKSSNAACKLAEKKSTPHNIHLAIKIISIKNAKAHYSYNTTKSDSKKKKLETSISKYNTHLESLTSLLINKSLPTALNRELVDLSKIDFNINNIEKQNYDDNVSIRSGWGSDFSSYSLQNGKELSEETSDSPPWLPTPDYDSFSVKNIANYHSSIKIDNSHDEDSACVATPDSMKRNQTESSETKTLARGEKIKCLQKQLNFI